MSTSIVYYSLQGNTKIVAEILGEKPGMEVVRLMDRKNLDGNAIARHEFSDLVDDPWQAVAECQRLIVLAPVWGFSIIPAMYTFLEKSDLHNKSVIIGVTSALGRISAKPVLQRYTAIVEGVGGKVTGTFNVRSGLKSTPNPEKLRLRTEAVVSQIESL